MLTDNVNPGRPHVDNEIFTMLNFFHGTRQHNRTEHTTNETTGVCCRLCRPTRSDRCTHPEMLRLLC